MYWYHGKVGRQAVREALEKAPVLLIADMDERAGLFKLLARVFGHLANIEHFQPWATLAIVERDLPGPRAPPNPI